MSYENIDHAMHYLIDVKTEFGKCDISVSVENNPLRDSIHISEIHIDEKSILEQHQLATSHQHNVIVYIHQEFKNTAKTFKTIVLKNIVENNCEFENTLNLTT